MGKVTHIGKDTNIASLYSVKQVLDDVLCDLEKGENYNKAMILLLDDRDGKYIVQPYMAGIQNIGEEVLLLEVAKGLSLDRMNF